MPLSSACIGAQIVITAVFPSTILDCDKTRVGEKLLVSRDERREAVLNDLLHSGAFVRTFTWLVFIRYGSSLSLRPKNNAHMVRCTVIGELDMHAARRDRYAIELN